MVEASTDMDKILLGNTRELKEIRVSRVTSGLFHVNILGAYNVIYIAVYSVYTVEFKLNLRLLYHKAS